MESQLSADRQLNKDCTDALNLIEMFLGSFAPITWKITDVSPTFNTVMHSWMWFE